MPCPLTLRLSLVQFRFLLVASCARCDDGGWCDGDGLRRLDLAADFPIGEGRALNIEVILSGIQGRYLARRQLATGNPVIASRRGLRQLENGKPLRSLRSLIDKDSSGSDASRGYGCGEVAG